MNPPLSRLRWLTILLPCLVVAVFSYVWRHHELDDALIYLRYIHNVQLGHGLVYNPGEKFNGLTSPLFAYILIAASTLLGDVRTAAITVSAVFMAGAAVLAGRLFARTEWEALLLSCTVACFAFFYGTYGMESSLFLLLIAASLLLYQRGNDGFVIALALLLITRSEGVFLALPMMVDLWLRERRLPRWRLMAVAAGIALAPMLINTLYYGAPLPATGSAKIGQGRSGLWGTGWIFFDRAEIVRAAFAGNDAVALAAMVLSSFGAFTLLEHRVARVALAFVGLLALFYGGLNIPGYHWYYAPFVFLMLVFAARGAGRLGSLLLQRGWRDDRAYLFLVLMLGLALAVSRVAPVRGGGRHEAYAQAGLWIKANTPPQATIGAVEIGTLGWYAERRIVDILGLVNPHNAGYIGRADVYSWLKHYQPDYILRHEPPWPHEPAVSFLERNQAYAPVPGFALPGYALLQKQPGVSDARIAELAGIGRDRVGMLQSMARSSAVGAPLVALDGDLLFAHAPSAVSLTLPRAVKALSVSFGVKAEAEGRHRGLCFDVRRAKDDTPLMQECIAAEAKGAAMQAHRLVPVEAAAGEVLRFSTRCQSSCDAGWTYWREVLLQ
ncbi:MAG: hypothetical protein HY855_12085 [Burkholderiales bacterium]|nr:hypothetical protein [Burkholderiales bacterium]